MSDLGNYCFKASSSLNKYPDLNLLSDFQPFTTISFNASTMSPPHGQSNSYKCSPPLPFVPDQDIYSPLTQTHVNNWNSWHDVLGGENHDTKYGRRRLKKQHNVSVHHIIRQELRRPWVRHYTEQQICRDIVSILSVSLVSCHSFKEELTFFSPDAYKTRTTNILKYHKDNPTQQAVWENEIGTNQTPIQQHYWVFASINSYRAYLLLETCGVLRSRRGQLLRQQDEGACEIKGETF